MRFAVPESINRDYIRNFRKRFSLTQSNLASLLNVSKKTVESWESGKREISGPVTTALFLLNNNPNLLENLKIKKHTSKMRYIYMAGNEISTIIDVDHQNKDVQIVNYTTNNNRKAFGIRENITYADFEAFLEDRCFPRSRDKMKVQLRELGIPFYDPYLIIEKTQGRMAEDNYWLKVEKYGDTD